MLLVFRDTQEDDLRRGGRLPGKALGFLSNTSEENGGFACLSPTTWMLLRGAGAAAAAAPDHSANFVPTNRKCKRSPAEASESAHLHATLTAE